jgi:hypothetical protein
MVTPHHDRPQVPKDSWVRELFKSPPPVIPAPTKPAPKKGKP